MKNDIIEEDKDGWLRIINRTSQDCFKKYICEHIKPDCGTTGKYLFFSDDQKLLIKIAKIILTKYELDFAKIGESWTPHKGKYVMCIMDYAPRFVEDLKKYADDGVVRYTKWKWENDSVKGKYSKISLDSIYALNKNKKKTGEKEKW